MILVLTVLFVVSLSLIGLGAWLYIITYYFYLHPGLSPQILTFFDKPYGTLGFVLVGSGVLVLAVTLGLLFDWYRFLIHRHTCPVDLV